MLLGTPIQRLLLLVDTCYSGRGGDEVAAAALTEFTRSWDPNITGGFVVINSAQPAEQAETGAFPKLLDEAVHNLATAGHAPPALDIAAVVTAMNESPARPGYQRIGWTPVGLTGQIPDFLPNPSAPGVPVGHRPALATGHRVGDAGGTPRGRVPSSFPCPSHGLAQRAACRVVVQRTAQSTCGHRRVAKNPVTLELEPSCHCGPGVWKNRRVGLGVHPGRRRTTSHCAVDALRPAARSSSAHWWCGCHDLRRRADHGSGIGRAGGGGADTRRQGCRSGRRARLQDKSVRRADRRPRRGCRSTASDQPVARTAAGARGGSDPATARHPPASPSAAATSHRPNDRPR